jgi:hypothetical protein
MTHGGSKHDPAATIMTEDAKTEKYTAGSPCGAYIEIPFKIHDSRSVDLDKSCFIHYTYTAIV